MNEIEEMSFNGRKTFNNRWDQLFLILLRPIVTGKVVCENWIKNLLNNFGWSGVNSIAFIDYNNSVYVTDIKELPELIYLNQDDA